MILKILIKLFALVQHYKNSFWIKNPHKAQQRTFNYLIQKAKKTEFGRDHNFDKISNHQDFVKNVPIRDYEKIKSYVEKVRKGEPNILWSGKPLYFSKTSGTTSGVKYIPISKESISTHINSARDAILSYIYYTGNAKIFFGKQIFLQGSPTLEIINEIKTGRLSGIVAHHVPKYLQRSRMPTWNTNCIEDWEKKVEKIIEETLVENMTIIGGIPPWVQMYFEKIKQKTNMPISKVFRNFSLFIYGGVNFEPYRNIFEDLIGKKIDTIELFPASEGFFAYQDKPGREDLLLILNNKIFYEFIELDHFKKNKFKRLTLKDVITNKDYVMIVSTNAGLWAYNVGDTIRFTSLKPFRILVTGRVKHFISAFGEHVIGKEVETALNKTLKNTDVKVVEFTVAPQNNPESGLPHHEWFIEFDNLPESLSEFSKKLDDFMQEENIYYKDLISGKILKPLVIRKVTKNGFKIYMKKIGKLGGQNKLPRLSNDRSIVNKLLN